MTRLPAQRAARSVAFGNGRGRRPGARRRAVHQLERLEDRTLLSFTPIPVPDAAYTSGTTNLASAIPPDGTALTTLSDSAETITFSSSVTAGTVGTTWGTWSSPPAVESATPRTLEAAPATTSLTLTLSKPASQFGIEIEPRAFGVSNITTDFYEGATLVGSITQGVEGNGGAVLFAGSTPDQAFTRVVITAAASANGFAIAQPRYTLAQADLGITQTVDAAQAIPGQTLTYTITVTNNGPNDAVNPSIAGTLPAGYDNASFSFGTTAPGWTGVFSVGPGVLQYVSPSLASGATASFSYSIAVASSTAPGTSLANTVTISSDTADPSPGNNSSTATTLVVSPFVTIDGNALDNNFVIMVDPVDSNYIDFITDGTTYQRLQSTIQAIAVNGLAGNDTLTVDSTNGAIAFPINYDGGPGQNSLVLLGGTATSDVYAPGPGVGAGTSTLVFGEVTERISFQNLAPVLDVVAGPLTVLGTPSNDTINYSAATTAGNGLVVVNNFESIEFNSKTTLTLNGLAGDDTITINNTTIPTGLTTVSVVGGIGNDTLVVDANNQPVLTTFITGSQVNIPGATPIPVSYDSTVESLRIVRATDNLTGTALAISGTEAQPLVNVPVATFNFSDPASPVVTGNASDFAATIDWGDGSTSPGTVVASSGGGFSVLGSHTYVGAGAFVVTTTVNDLGSTRRFTVSGVPVTIVDNAGASATIAPVAPATNATIAIAALDATGVPISGFDGLPVGTLPPAAPPADVLVATFLDTGTISPIPTYTASIDWGDGSPATAATRITQAGTPQGVVFSVYGTHTYLTTGSFPVVTTITKTEGSGGSALTSVATASSAAVIADAPLSAPAQTPISTTEAALFPVPQYAPPAFSGQVAVFSDANTLSSSAGEFTATIDWGDGTGVSPGTVTAGAAAGTFLVSGAHTYADSGADGSDGTFTIQVFIVDSGGASLTVINSASVADRAIALTGALNPASDSGKFNNDGITNVAQPNFYGTSEPLSLVSVYANGTLVARTQTDSHGYWTATSILLPDGSYAITASATDQFGVTTAGPLSVVPSLLIDTVGPRVTYAGFDRMFGTAYYTFQDYLADGTTPGGSGLLAQSLGDAANFSLNRVHTRPPGTYIATDISVLAGMTTASNDVTVVFNNGSYMKGGYFQIIARSKSGALPSGIQDVAGNALDGEFYGQESASGNGVPGGDFVANIKSIHQNTPGYGYSGPLTIIGTPHPNDPPWKVPAIVKKHPVKTVTPPVKKPAKVAVPKTPVTTQKHTTIRATSSSPMTLDSWYNIRQRMLQNASGARGVR